MSITTTQKLKEIGVKYHFRNACSHRNIPNAFRAKNLYKTINKCCPPVSIKISKTLATNIKLELPAGYHWYNSITIYKTEKKNWSKNISIKLFLKQYRYPTYTKVPLSKCDLDCGRDDSIWYLLNLERTLFSWERVN